MIKHSSLCNQRTYRDGKRDGQKEVLDKIRTEIEEQKQRECFDSYDEMFAYRTGLEDAIDIINKYKAESED